MPYKIGDRTLPLDVQWTHNHIQYGPQWLRLSTPEMRAELGIVYVPEPPVYDQRFYKGRDRNGDLIPKPVEGLAEHWIYKTKEKARSLLSASDHLMTQLLEQERTYTAAKKAFSKDPRSSWRARVRKACSDKVAMIEQSSRSSSSETELDSVNALRQYVLSETYKTWPNL